MRVPGCHLAEVDVETGWFTLLLEDMAPATQGDQIDGCTPAEAALAMDQLSSLHAPLWEDAQLAALGWLNRQTPASAEFTAALVASLWPGFLDRYGALLTPAEIGICGRLVERLGPYLADRSGPMTVVHGDYRPDNMLFGHEAAGAAAPLTVVDWQTVVWGPPMVDVSYFLACAVAQPQQRAELEGELVRRYHEGLLSHGVTGFSWEQCWRDYRRCSFTALVMAIASSMLVQQTDRGDQMFLASVQRACAQVDHLEALELLP
jgi:aminoglycoside/choline kinase family phosphotransferase